MKTLIALLCLSAQLHAAVYLPTDASNTNTSVSAGASAAIIAATNNITICLWLTRDPVIDAAAGLMSWGYLADPNSRMNWNLGISAGNVLEFFYYRSPGSGVTASQWRTSAGAYLGTNTLDFFALTYSYSDSNSIKWYVNGELKTGTWIANPSNVAPGGNNTSAMYIGQGRAAGAEVSCNDGRRWGGYYSEVCIWNTILSITELERIRNSRVKGMPMQIRNSNLILYLPMEVLAQSLVADGATRWPDRRHFGQFASWCNTGPTDPVGSAERVCSYQPNE